MGQLGYDMAPSEFTRRLGRLGGDSIFVAVDGDACRGLMVLHIAAMLQVGHGVARIMTLVVDAACRGQGVGRRLTLHAAAWARAAGCDVLELTTGVQREQAHAFYTAAGFTMGALRFSMDLCDAGRETGS